MEDDKTSYNQQMRRLLESCWRELLPGDSRLETKIFQRARGRARWCEGCDGIAEEAGPLPRHGHSHAQDPQPQPALWQVQVGEVLQDTQLFQV